MAYRMVFAADLVPTETNRKYFIEGNIKHLFGDELIQFLQEADFRCFNLEIPLTTNQFTAVYPGPHLKADPETVNAIKGLEPSLLTLGNNHALDQGEKGLKDTISTLENAGIPFTGAGSNLEKAERPYILSADGYKIGVINFSEYEFAAATEQTYGVNPYDPLTSFDSVRDLKKECDVVIVLYHGGKEFYRYPSPRLQRVCRKFVECGASLVICQHTHCIGCKEIFKGAHIVYGQGNFLFDRNEDEFKKTGLFVECTIESGALTEIGFIPFVKRGECVRIADEEEAAGILEEFEARSLQIKEPGFVQEEYDKLAQQYYGQYVFRLLGRHKWIRLLNKVTNGKYAENYYSPKEAIAVLNVISPENHEELFKAGLRIKGRNFYNK